LAIGLLRRNVSVRIYEAAPAFKEIGLGLSIGPAAHRAMPLIDPRIHQAYDSLIATHADSPGYESFRQAWFEYVWATGERAGQVLLDLKAPPSGQTTVRKAEFLDALVALIPSETAHFGKRLETLNETSDGVEMFFDDGTSASAEVVIGCDGIHSKVKEFIVPEEHRQTRPRYSGMYGYRAVLDMDVLERAVGKHRARVATTYVG
jgi:salicylate hydroxylase